MWAETMAPCGSVGNRLATGAELSGALRAVVADGLCRFRPAAEGIRFVLDRVPRPGPDRPADQASERFVPRRHVGPSSSTPRREEKTG